MKPVRMVVVTGLSGSGRSAALKAFEDMGYYCVDNLPLVLLSDFVRFAHDSDQASRSAIGIDVREKDFASLFPGLYRSLKDSGSGIELLFLGAPLQRNPPSSPPGAGGDCIDRRDQERAGSS
jgi:UPF0042 nucleotide-binding protein